MPPKNPYAEFQQPAATANPYAAFQQPAADPTPGSGTVDGVQLPGFAPTPAPNMQPARGFQSPHPYLDTASPSNVAAANVIKGAVKSIPGTLANVAKLVPGSSDAWQPLQQAAQTNGTAQAIGKGVGNAAQFLIPGAAEEKLGLFGASKLPEAFAPLARMGASALGTGAVNKAQGGSFTAGALMGGASNGATQVVKAWAPQVAESALKVLGNDRMYGRTVGKAALEDTTGWNPATVAKSAQSKIDELTPQLEQSAADASQGGARGSLTPARKAVQDTIDGHFNNRAVNTANDIKPLKSFLAKDSVTGLPLSDSQTPTGLLRLKQGLDADHIGNWNPNKNTPQTLGAARQAYGHLADEFHAAAPGTQELDQRVSSLIPVADRANRVSLGAPTTQQLFNKLAVPTGALAAPIAGGLYGHEQGGTGGAVAGAAAGMMLPALLATPSGQMALARGLYSGTLPKVIAPLITGAALNTGRGLYGGVKPQGK